MCTLEKLREPQINFFYPQSSCYIQSMILCWVHQYRCFCQEHCFYQDHSSRGWGGTSKIWTIVNCRGSCPVQNVYNVYTWWHGWLVRKALASHQGDPVRFPVGAIMLVELCVGIAVPRGFSRLSGFPPSGKNQTLLILAVLRGHNGLMWLAAECALACLLLEHIVAASFAIQL